MEGSQHMYHHHCCPIQYGRKWNTDIKLYNAVVTKLSPAPESILELTVPGCKTDCNANRYKCLKNGGMKCTEMCNCKNFENVE